LFALVEHVGMIGKHWCAVFRCECGTLKKMPVSTAKTGKIKSCGCLTKNRYKEDAAQKKLANKSIDLGARFGLLVFVEYTQAVGSNRYARFKCDCGGVVERRASLVKRGGIKSCGCLPGGPGKRHGHCSDGKSTKTYECWRAMLDRCSNSKNKSFKDYGARGISVCDRWLTFENFLADMGEAPENLSIDRYPNNDGNYEPGNCRWATVAQQNSNKRGNTVLEFDGKKATIAEWSAMTGIKDCTISERLRHGWSVEKALTTKARKYGTN
jgi:hypothetical protein